MPRPPLSLLPAPCGPDSLYLTPCCWQIPSKRIPRVSCLPLSLTTSLPNAHNTTPRLTHLRTTSLRTHFHAPPNHAPTHASTVGLYSFGGATAPTVSGDIKYKVSAAVKLDMVFASIQDMDAFQQGAQTRYRNFEWMSE